MLFHFALSQGPHVLVFSNAVNIKFVLIIFKVGQDSAVGIATCYWLDGPGIKSWWRGLDFPHPSDWPWGLPSHLYNGYQVFPGSKAAKAWR